MNNKREKHESWGVIGLYHQYHSGRELFGSDVTNHNTICLKIKTAQCGRELGRDWIMGDETLIEVTLSANQFADMLTNTNIGDGVPCTIEYVRGIGGIQYKPQKPRIEVIEEERDNLAESVLENIQSSITMVEELVKNKKISKSVGNDLVLNMNKAYSDLVGGGKEFYKKQAKREVERMVVEAKRQVQEYVDSKIYSTGLQILKDGYIPPKLIGEETCVEEV